jgi:hypothetical protein
MRLQMSTSFAKCEGKGLLGRSKHRWVTPNIKMGKVKSKVVPLHAMEALGGRGDIAPTHSRPRH